jgi:hypothetical protein
MLDESLDAVFSMVEKAFMRLQAGDVLVSCLEKDDTAPMQKLVEGLVLAGPQSLNALREVRAEVTTRKVEFQEEIARVFSKMEDELHVLGVNLAILPDHISIHHLEPTNFHHLLGHQGFPDDASQVKCARLLNSSKEIMSQLARQILLLDEVELYLDDWIWGLMYQSAHQIGAGIVRSGKLKKHLH